MHASVLLPWEVFALMEKLKRSPDKIANLKKKYTNISMKCKVSVNLQDFFVQTRLVSTFDRVSVIESVQTSLDLPQTTW